MIHNKYQKIPSGYILVNKPKGMSSFFALKKIQKKLSDELKVFFDGKKKVKIGHAGTLDLLAEGLLLCGVEQGTKILSEMILSKKSYTAEIFLGKFSETDDEEGEKYDYVDDDTSHIGAITNRKNPSREEIQELLETKFSGKIQQTPPLYSALKIAGKRACDRVRKSNNSVGANPCGRPENLLNIEEEIQKKTREIEIFQIKILEYDFPKLKIFVECGSGTYIRSLARDIGAELKLGGYLTFLRRDSIGNFKLKDAVNIDDVSFKDIHKFRPEMFNLPKIFVSLGEKKKLKHGQRLRLFNTKNLDEIEKKRVLMVDKISRELIGFGEQDGGILRPRKIFS